MVRVSRRPLRSPVPTLAFLILIVPLAVPARGLATPRLELAEPAVPRGEAVRITVEGAPGEQFAVALSRSDTGLVVRGVALDLGEDAVVVGTGRLDERGRATLALRPPFAEAGVAKLHLQAVTAPDPDFEGLAPSAVRVIREAGGEGPVLTRVTARGAAGEPAALETPLALAAPAGRAAALLGCMGCVAAAQVLDGDVPVAIVGIVPTKVTGEGGAIGVGDLLTTALTAGHAMRAGGSGPRSGTILGKALEPFRGQRGVIRVLLLPR